MNLPSITTPSGIFDYLIASIILLALLFAIYWGALYFGIIEPFIFGTAAPAI
jgi:hypothetical protein